MALAHVKPMSLRRYLQRNLGHVAQCAAVRAKRASTANDPDARPIYACVTQYRGRIGDGGTRDERHLMETAPLQITCASKDILLHSSNGKGQI
jgi:hypothetical protein